MYEIRKMLFKVFKPTLNYPIYNQRNKPWLMAHEIVLFCDPNNLTDDECYILNFVNVIGELKTIQEKYPQPTTKTLRILNYHEKIWKQLCKKLGWE